MRTLGVDTLLHTRLPEHWGGLTQFWCLSLLHLSPGTKVLRQPEHLIPRVRSGKAKHLGLGLSEHKVSGALEYGHIFLVKTWNTEEVDWAIGRVSHTSCSVLVGWWLSLCCGSFWVYCFSGVEEAHCLIPSTVMSWSPEHSLGSVLLMLLSQEVLGTRKYSRLWTRACFPILPLVSNLDKRLDGFRLGVSLSIKTAKCNLNFRI